MFLTLCTESYQKYFNTRLKVLTIASKWLHASISLTPHTNSTPIILICCGPFKKRPSKNYYNSYITHLKTIHLVKFQGLLLYSYIIHMIVGFNFHSVLHHLIVIGDAAILDNWIVPYKDYIWSWNFKDPLINWIVKVLFLYCWNVNQLSVSWQHNHSLILRV